VRARRGRGGLGVGTEELIREIPCVKGDTGGLLSYDFFIRYYAAKLVRRLTALRQQRMQGKSPEIQASNYLVLTQKIYLCVSLTRCGQTH
jgi:hypothetical protein